MKVVVYSFPGVAVLSLFMNACASHGTPPAEKYAAEGLAKTCRISVRSDFMDTDGCFSGKNPDGTRQVKAEYLSKIDFSIFPNKMAVYYDWTRSQTKTSLHSSMAIGYILPNGKARDVVFHDNGPDYFEAGLARFVGENGKTGFLNEELQVAIEPNHEFYSPFHEGKAYFCDGCRWEGEGEYRELKGGLWGTVDRKGKKLAGPFSYDELKRRLASGKR